MVVFPPAATHAAAVTSTPTPPRVAKWLVKEISAGPWMKIRSAQIGPSKHRLANEKMIKSNERGESHEK